MEKKENVIEFPLGYYYPSLGVWVNGRYEMSLDRQECEEAGLLYLRGQCFFIGRDEVVRTYRVFKWDSEKGEPVYEYYVVLRS